MASTSASGVGQVSQPGLENATYVFDLEPWSNFLDKNYGNDKNVYTHNSQIVLVSVPHVAGRLTEAHRTQLAIQDTGNRVCVCLSLCECVLLLQEISQLCVN